MNSKSEMFWLVSTQCLPASLDRTSWGPVDSHHRKSHRQPGPEKFWSLKARSAIRQLFSRPSLNVPNPSLTLFVSAAFLRTTDIFQTGMTALLPRIFLASAKIFFQSSTIRFCNTVELEVWTGAPGVA